MNIDKNLIDNHLDEFFTWLLEGAKNFFEDEKLSPPLSILEVENQYILEQASFKSWVSENIIESVNNRLNRALAFLNYEQFCSENLLKMETKKKFFSLMLDNYICQKSHGEMCYKDIDIKKIEQATTLFSDLDN